MNSLKDFIKGLYEDSDNQMKDIYNQQENDKKSIFDKIGSILLNYTIIDNLLNLTLGQKNSLYDSVSTLIIKLFSKETAETKNVVTDVLKSTIKKSAKYYDLEFKVGLNKNTKVTSTLVNKDTEKFIKKIYKGENFSKRIWKNNNEVSKEVQNEIEKLLKGETSVNDIKKIIEKKFETNKFNAKRLVESEVSRVHDEIFKKYCRDNGIEKVIYKATFCNTCEFCKKDHNRTFDLDKAPQLPRHPQCKCYFSIIYNNIDYMGNKINPKYIQVKINLMNGKINKLNKVTNSKYNMYTGSDFNINDNLAAILYEKKFNEIKNKLPKGFTLPKNIVVIDFAKNKIGEGIGGYLRSENTLYLNSKYNNDDKILQYVNQRSGWFANKKEISVILHELGHKYHYDLIDKIAKNKNWSYNETIKYFNSSIEKEIENKAKLQNKSVQKYIKENLSEYAERGYSDGFVYPERYDKRFNEVLAEYFSIRQQDNEFVKLIQLKIKEMSK